MSATFDFNEEYTLEDNRVLLRPLRLTDEEYLFPFTEAEPDLWQYGTTQVSGGDHFQRYLATALRGRAEHTAYPFIVFDKQLNRYAGSTRFYDYQPDHLYTQLGYTWYGRDFRGTGLNKHSKFLLLSFAFDTLALARVEFRADANNQRSIAAMKSIGCTVEGTLRSNLATAFGTRRSSIVLSILADEWDATVREQLQGQLRK